MADVFVGRERERARLSALLPPVTTGGVLVTVLGPPGVGKTRLVRQLLAEGLAAVFCDLTAADDLDALLRRVARAVGLPPSTDLADVGSVLATRTDTLVLDNFEQLAAVAAGTVAAWAAAGASLLVTSRHRLGAAGEQLLELPPLPVADARAMFLDRARALGSEPDEAVAEDIVRRLDGLPLAIELGAARLRVLSPEQLLDRIVEDAAVVSSVPGTDGVRPGGLARAIAASWDMLEPWARASLADASIFTGAFDLDAAEAVLRPRGGPSVLDALQHLRDRSLVAVLPATAGRARYALLASIREFVRPYVDDARDLAARHTAHYLALARRFGGRADDGDAAARAVLAADADNLLLAAERTAGASEALEIALGLVASGALSTSAAHRLLDAALGDPDTPALLRARGLEARATQRRFLGRVDESVADLDEALRLAGDTRGFSARVWMGLGNAETVRVRWPSARAWFAKALSVAEAGDDLGAVGRIRTLVAATLYNEDRLDEATRELEAGLGALRAAGDRAFEGRAASSLGVVRLAAGDTARARAHLEEAGRIHAAVADAHWAAVTESYVGALLAEEGDLGAAEARLSAAGKALRTLGVRRAEGVALFMAVGLALEVGDAERALGLAHEALPFARRVCPDHEPLLQARLGIAAASLGRLDSARAAFATAEALPLERPGFVAALAIDRAHLGLAEGVDPASLAALLEPAVETFETRLSVRLLRRALDAVRASQQASKQAQPLVVERGGGWFHAPGAEARVELYRRKPLRRLLEALADHAGREPGRALPIAELVRAGWPAEVMLPSAGNERIYTAIATLRRMGLRDLILQRHDGYLLDPAVSVVWA